MNARDEVVLKLRNDLRNALDALECLRSEQNGTPLIRRESEYSAAIKACDEVLTKHGRQS